MTEIFDYWHKNGKSGLFLNSSAQRAVHVEQGTVGFLPVPNQLEAVTYYVGAEGIDLATIALNIRSSSGAANMRMGIYSSASASSKNVYPGALVADLGELALNPTGVKTWTANTSLPQGLYWIAWNVTANACQWGCYESISSHDVFTPLGRSASGARYSSVTVASTYGAMPATFPSGGALVIGTSGRIPFFVMQAASAVTTPPVLPTSGLIADWRMNGNFNDSFGPNNGTSGGSPVFPAGLYSGTQAYQVAVSAIPNMGSNISLAGLPTGFSVSVWVYLNADNFNKGIIEKGNLSSVNGDWNLEFVPTNTVRVMMNTAAVIVTAGTAISSLAWHHFVATYDQISLKIYVDGALSASTASTVPLNNTYNTVNIGTYYDYGQPMNGLISNVGYWNRALTAAEVYSISRR